MADGEHKRQKDNQPSPQHESTALKGASPPDHASTPVDTGSSEPDAIPINHDSQMITDGLRVNDATSEGEELVKTLPSPTSSTHTPSSELRISREEENGANDRTANAKAFPGSTSPSLPACITMDDAAAEKVGEEGICRMHKYWLYETPQRFYVVGGDVTERKFRLLKLDRATDSGDLSIVEDDIVYTKKDMNQLLDTLGEGNKASGGMKLRYSFGGLLGFVKFTGAYYMLLITKKSQVAVIGGHYIYQIDGTELISLTVSAFRSKVEKDPEEARFIGILNNLDLTRSFYFSYSYDITRTLQRNILPERETLQLGHTQLTTRNHNSMFVWNHHFLKPASSALNTAYDWCLPIIHGFVDQRRKLSIFF